jgi:uncharacterized protein
MKGIEIPLSFLAGAALAALATFYFTEANCERSFKTRVQAHFAEAIVRADSAYRTQSQSVAKWELEHLSQLMQSGFVSTFEPADRIAFYQFLTSARLARINRDLGNEEEYRKHLNVALNCGATVSANVTNATMLFELLSKFDNQSPNP